MNISTRLYLGALAAAVFPFVAPAPAAATRDLVDRSPFVWEGYTPPRPPEVHRPPPPPQGPQPLDGIEFRGMTRWNGETIFSIFDPTHNRSYWLGLNQSEGGFTITGFMDDEDAIVVRHDNRTRTVNLRDARIQAMPAAAPQQAQPPQPGQAQAQSPENRMQQLAEEIRRRRELRRQIVEGAQAGGAGQQHYQPPATPQTMPEGMPPFPQ